MTLVIVDTNLVPRIFVPGDPNFSDMHRALVLGETHQVTAVHGGKLTEEYNVMSSYSRLFVQLSRAGRLRHVSNQQVVAETHRVETSGTCVSDDPHIIGLGIVSRARVLCSNDKLLIQDFKNKQLLDHPRGRVYRGKQHNALLRQH